jgi:glycine cleavage system pyridoxal-binding protein P
MVTDLTAMDIANASMLDEATAAAEAMTLAMRTVKSKSKVFVVSRACHPQTIEVIQTRAQPLGIEVLVPQSADAFTAALNAEHFAALVQYPCSTGLVEDLSGYAAQSHAQSAAFIVAADLLALTLLKPPGEMGADIVVGTTQRFGMPMGAGGPHAAYMACRDEYKRSLPGRLVGARQTRLPPGPANPRTTHPPRKGHQQHLHRAGAPRRGGQHVRRVPRPRGLEAHCAPRGELHRDLRARPAEPGLQIAQRHRV